MARSFVGYGASIQILPRERIKLMFPIFAVKGSVPKPETIPMGRMKPGQLGIIRENSSLDGTIVICRGGEECAVIVALNHQVHWWSHSSLISLPVELLPSGVMFEYVQEEEA